MRLLLVLSILALAACGNGKNAPAPKISQNVSKAKAGPLDPLSDSVISNYLSLNEVLVRWDSSKVNTLASSLILSMDNLKRSISPDSLKSLQLLNKAKQEISNLVKTRSLEAKKRAYHKSNTSFFEFLRSTNYSSSSLYLQQCPMAFNDNEQGLWLSRSKEIRNPYLGLFHPRYGKGMLECGENKDVLNGTLEEE